VRYGKRYRRSARCLVASLRGMGARVTFDGPLATEAFSNLLAAYFIRDTQLTELGRRIEEIAKTEPFADDVTRLSALRGISTLSAMAILSETCDFSRFADASAYMAFTGLISSEHSSGASRHQGSITKTGNRHIRRVLVEAAWACRHAPAVRGTLQMRLEGMPPEVVTYSWAAQVRLNRTFRTISARKGAHTAVVATTRELAGFVWGLMTDNLGPAR